MSTSTYEVESATSPAGVSETAALSRHRLLCAALVAGCAVTAVVAANLVHPGSLLRSDPTLAHLLRGMAAIKAGMVVGAMAVLMWRFRSPITGGLAAAYMTCVWLATTAAVMVWQLSFIPAAATVFHAALLAALLLAWRDGGADFGKRVRSTGR